MVQRLLGAKVQPSLRARGQFTAGSAGPWKEGALQTGRVFFTALVAGPPDQRTLPASHGLSDAEPSVPDLFRDDTAAGEGMTGRR